MRFEHGILMLAASLLVFPGTTVADDQSDGGALDPPPSDNGGLVLALGNLSPCADTGPELNLPELLGGFQPTEVLLAIENGSVRYGRLAHAIDALAAIGSAEDLEYVLQSAEYISWAYLDDALSDEATDEDVPIKQAHVAAEIRAYVLSAWASRGDLPDETLSEMMWDTDPLPASRAIALGLASQQPGLVSDAVSACSLNAAAGAAASDVCPEP